MDAGGFTKLLREVARGLARIERQEVCCGDTTLQQFETLRLLHDAGGLTTGAVAERLGIDLSTASRNLAVLARDGYVRRVRELGDGRQVANRLTATGTRCVESLCCDERMVFAGVLARVPPAERPRVLDALRVLAAALEPQAAGCCAAPAAAPRKEGTMP